jgi:hypothetical protein
MKRIFRRDGIYLPRLWWWFPWGLTSPWRPRIWRGGDEWCNRPLCFTIPALGCFLIFQLWRPMRTMPCAECWADMGSDQRADYEPGGIYARG